MNTPERTAIAVDRFREILPEAEWRGTPPGTLIGLTDDSRKVLKGTIFIAVVGYETDGHLYLQNAIDSGAELLVVDSEHVSKNPHLLEPVGNHSLLLVKNTRLAASHLAAEYYGHPSREVKVHGITGTKGKTTTVNLLAEVLRAAGHRPATMGTLGVSFEDNHWSSGLTTPGPIDFQQWLRRLADHGATDIACEVSAHAGALSRTASVHFETITYMNLSRDHGDHFTPETYLDAKLAIARDAVLVNPKVTGIGNALDPHTQKFLEPVAPKNRHLFAAIDENENPDDIDSEILIQIRSRSSSDLTLFIHTETWEREIRLPLLGLFNAQNSAAAVAISTAINISPDDIAVGLTRIQQIPGRLERIDQGQDFLVVVDYAHAPQPAEEVLRCLRELTKGRLIGVMGAGGSRDRGKRPMIGEVLARDCDVAIITSDNPRDEDPLDIVNDIHVGVQRIRDLSAEVIIEIDRRTAIGIALGKARPGDTVAILGKGHETYQIFKDDTIHFDDREVAREWLTEHGFGGGEV